MQRSRELLRAMFDAAIAAAQPARCVPSHLPAKPSGRLIVIGSGKASAAMAKAVEDHWSGDLSGFVVTRYGYAVPCKRIEIFGIEGDRLAVIGQRGLRIAPEVRHGCPETPGARFPRGKLDYLVGQGCRGADLTGAQQDTSSCQLSRDGMRVESTRIVE